MGQAGHEHVPRHAQDRWCLLRSWENLYDKPQRLLAAVWYFSLQPGSRSVDSETFSYGNRVLGAKKSRLPLLWHQ